VIDAPREAINSLGVDLIEMARSGKRSFCCGAGGAQFWKEEEHGAKAVNVERYEEAKATGAGVVAVGCPFCMQMFETAKSTMGEGPVVKDVVELIAERLPEKQVLSAED
jgi:Fe-S oxidoreductase